MRRHDPSSSKPRTAFAELPEFATRRIGRYKHARFEPWGGRHLLHGATPAADAVHLSSNDYLCASDIPSLRKAQSDFLKQSKRQMFMSPIFQSGDTPARALENRLAAFLGCESTLLCQSGLAANAGLVQAIAGKKTQVYLDGQVHPSFTYGANAAGVDSHMFRHNDPEHARQLINQSGPGVLVVDAVYSANGSLCPLHAFCDLAAETGCVIIVDESHSAGVRGPQGSGLTAELGLTHKVHFLTASLSKAFAGRAGLIACSSDFKDYFHMTSYPTLFSSALLEHELVWLDAAADFLAAADDRRTRLAETTLRIRRALTEMAFDISSGTEQIIALQPGPERQTMQVRDALEQHGIFGSVFCWPATPRNESMVRLSLNSELSDSDIERLLDACRSLRIKLDSGTIK